ncbi:MAG: HflK protein [Burkholderiaceae bacterium]|jgi:membrane protease subunit HflK|nr:MAG: HflK protein [Burkholderiaceae bacterium]
MFNLNDPRWGRGDDKPTDRPEGESPQGGGSGGRGPNQGPPDLDELWRDFNRRLSGLFGGRRGGGSGGNGNPGGRGGSGGFGPDGKNTRVGAGLIAAVVVLIWLGSGFFIVQEGQQAVITQFGKYYETLGAGFHWRLPYPIQRDEKVFVTQIRSVDIGRDNIIKATGLRDSGMLTADENIVEIKFAVQYRLSNAREFLFDTKDPTAAVVQAAESAVREVVGKMTMDAALGDERDKIAPQVRELMQQILDRYQVGVQVVAVNLQQSGVRPPEQVQAAFDDVLKAGQEAERTKNEAQAYANDVIPRAVGTASRLKEEADGYKARVVAQAQGDTQRFNSVLDAYQKAPQVTRERMYVDAMQQIYANVSKLIVDTKQGSNLLYLPLDKLMQAAGQTVAPPPANPTSAAGGSTPPASGSANTPDDSDRFRDTSRLRDRDSR